MLQVLSDPIARLKPCLRCETSLKGHLDDKFCPTCGLSVWLSLNAGDSLESSNPDWLRKTACACYAMAATQLLGLITLLMIYLAPGIGFWMIVAHGLIGAAPMFLLAGNEKRHPDKLATHRMWLKIMASAQAAGGVLLVIYPRYYWVLIGIYAGAGLATWFYLRRVIRRSAKASLSKYASWILFIPALALFLKIPIFGFCVLVSVARLVMPLIPFVYFPGSMVLLALYGKVISQSAPVAEEHWKKETDPGKLGG